MRKQKISNKQLRFAQEYMIDQNATQAALRAGYAKISANVSGHNCINNYNVIKVLERLQSKAAAKTAYTQEVGLAKLLNAYNVEERLRQPSGMVSAIIGANRMHGYDKDANIGEKTIIVIAPRRKVIDSKEISNE